MNPMISVIIPTYNRAKTIARAIDSVLLQTYRHLEIIIVDDGSRDNTQEILEKYTDERIRLIIHEENKGVTAAKNTGLNNIAGDWFTIVDSDDEIVPQALEMMIKVPLEKDAEVDAVTCNGIDTSTGKLSGIGLEFDQYVNIKTLIIDCKGDFWGIIKTRLLLNHRFNERLQGYENTLWYKIGERAKRYYIHNTLLIIHTQGNDRVSKTSFSMEKISNHYQVLSEETHYLDILRQYQPGYFARDCLVAVGYLKADNKKAFAKIYLRYLKKMENYRLYKIITFLTYYSNPHLIKLTIKFWKAIK